MPICHDIPDFQASRRLIFFDAGTYAWALLKGCKSR